MATHEQEQGARGSWLTYRPDIKIMDCTIRDGGLINSHMFEDGFVKAVYDTCVAAGIDYMELGYKASKKIFSRDNNGAWKFCDEEDMRKIMDDNPTDLKISVMADAERTDYNTDILPKDKSVIDIVRVASYIHQIPTAIDMIKDAHDKGYETTINLMAVSLVNDRELGEALELLVQTPVDVLYIVDSFGYFYSEQIRSLAHTFLKHAEKTGKKVGIHAHNNQQLAYANTIEALILGVSYLDATINGMGRGAGNCPLELLLGFLKNPHFKLRPVLDCIQTKFLPLLQNMEWGYQIPYMLTGQLNMHPKSAIEMRKSDQTRDDYTQFYDQLMQED